MAENAFLIIDVCGETAMESVGSRLAESTTLPLILYLEGDLGAGKTTLARGILRGLGHQGSVKSPTYTLVEPYEFPDLTVYHFDLYRLSDPEELEWLGIRDYFSKKSLCIIEWPKNGLGILPNPDIKLKIEKSESCRRLFAEYFNEQGRVLLTTLAQRIKTTAQDDIKITS